MSYGYPDRKIIWPDGSMIPRELHDMLLIRFGRGLRIEHGDFKWMSDKSLAMKFRLSVDQGTGRPKIWEIEFSYPPQEATAVLPEATSSEREWFTMMIRTHIIEWQDGGPSIIGSARLVKLCPPIPINPPLQRLKGQHLSLRWLGLEGGSGLGEEPVDERRSVLDALEPVLDDRGELVHTRAIRLPRPFFMFAQTPSAGLSSGA